jgi:hypothetical protein
MEVGGISLLDHAPFSPSNISLLAFGVTLYAMGFMELARRHDVSKKTEEISKTATS